MNAHDEQLERELEAALARLASDAVPDSARPPAPPWQQERTHGRLADVRRFGRATPWLVAAVLLVIAGLGVGASVVFDASAPDRGPVATDGPSPTVTSTSSQGSTEDPTTTPTPTSTPSLDRGTNGAEPGDGLGQSVAGIGTYGAVSAGMTEAQAAAALGGTAAFTALGSCTEYVDDATGVTVEAVDGVVVGVIPPDSATDADGNGKGTPLSTLRASYPDGTLEQSSSGWVYFVLDGDDGLGFVLDSVTTPVDTDPVFTLRPGTADFAKGFELCSG